MFRSVSGRFFRWRDWRRSTCAGKGVRHHRLLLVIALSALGLASCAGPQRKPPPPRPVPARPRPAHTIPFDSRYGLPVITFQHARLPPLELGLDTGYGRSRPMLASESIARRSEFHRLTHHLLGFHWRSAAWGPKRESSARFAAGPVSLGYQGVRVLNERFRSRSPFRLLANVADGLIGLHSFADSWVTEFDFDRRVIALYQRPGFTYAGKGAEITLSYDHGGRPMIEARCEPPVCGTKPIELLVDTGFVGDVMLLRETAAPAPQEPAAPVIDFHHHKGCRAHRGRLTLGSLELEEILFAVCPKGAYGEYGPLLGAGVLSRFRVIFDTDRHRMILEPGKNVHRRSEWNMLGVWWRPEPGWPPRLVSVPPGSLGEKPDLLVGDVVLSINGRDASKLAEWELWEAATGAWGMTLTFRIRRGEKEQEVTVRLKPMI